jgi:hypothetical protein
MTREQYAEFKRCVEMPAKGSKLLFWKKNQLSKGNKGLDAVIQKEITDNEGSTVWTDRKARLLRCIAQKKASCPRDEKKENA